MSRTSIEVEDRREEQGGRGHSYQPRGLLSSCGRPLSASWCLWELRAGGRETHSALHPAAEPSLLIEKSMGSLGLVARHEEQSLL